jgi:hypothetical protein
MNDGEDISNSIMELLLDATDTEGQRLFHSIEHTRKSDTIRAIFTQQNQSGYNKILNDPDTWLSDKFTDASVATIFHKHQEVKAYTSTIEQRKSQYQLKFDAYVKYIAKQLCSVNTNEPDESFDTAPNRMPKRRINLSYVTVITTLSPRPVLYVNAYIFQQNDSDTIDMSLGIPATAANRTHVKPPVNPIRA